MTDPLRAADDLLRRLGEWDMLYVSPEGKPVTSDGPYWQLEIQRVRAQIAPALADTRETP
jgi:hypothetical protein